MCAWGAQLGYYFQLWRRKNGDSEVASESEHAAALAEQAKATAAFAAALTAPQPSKAKSQPSGVSSIICERL